MLAALPRLLDGYFINQSEDELRTRTAVVKELIESQLEQAQGSGSDAPRPILTGTDPIAASQYVTKALGSAESGYLHDKTQDVAQANVSVTIATSPQSAAGCRLRTRGTVA